MMESEKVDRVVGAIKQSSDLAYFFSKLESPDWLKPLAARHFFISPPEPIHEGDTIRYPEWPAGGYLVRMASLVPDQVFVILRSIPPTPNFRATEDIIDAAMHLSTEGRGQILTH